MHTIQESLVKAGLQSGSTFDLNQIRLLLDQGRVDTHNKSTGDLKFYDCPKCLNRGDFLKLRDGGGVVAFPCDCGEIRKMYRLIHASGLESLLRENTFSRYQVYEKWQQELKESAMAYAGKPEGWFVLCGQVGSGKTHLCTAICGEALRRRIPVRYMLWVQESEKLKYMENPQDREDALEVLRTAPMLYIDDLFKPVRDGTTFAKPTKADIRMAFDILSERYRNRLPTVISTERTAEELLDIDEAIGSRISEMARGKLYTIARDPSRNMRMKQ